MVPKDGDATASLGHVLLPHSSGAEWFPPVLSEVPVLQKCPLALILSPGPFEKVWPCILCLPLRQWKMYLQPHRPSLLWAEEAQLPWSPLMCHVFQTLANLVAAAGLQLLTISLVPGARLGTALPVQPWQGLAVGKAALMMS